MESQPDTFVFQALLQRYNGASNELLNAHAEVLRLGARVAELEKESAAKDEKIAELRSAFPGVIAAIPKDEAA